MLIVERSFDESGEAVQQPVSAVTSYYGIVGVEFQGCRVCAVLRFNDIGYGVADVRLHRL